MTRPATTIRDLLLPDGARVDLVLAGDRIRAVLPAGRAPESPEQTIDGTGWLLLPPFAEPHIHLDKALTIDRAPNRTGDLTGAIDAWLRFRRDLDEDEVLGRARTALRAAALAGASAVRTHVDTGADIGLVGVRALTRLREEVRGTIELQIVAGHGLPVTGPDGAAGTRVLRAALDAGADAVGGAPSLDDDPVGAWHVLREVAEAHGVPLDLHVDETLDPTVFLLETIADDAAERSVPLTVDHIVSLSAQSRETRERVARRLAEAEVPVVTLPQTNLYLQGRGAGPAAPRGLTAVHELSAAGVVLAAGADNVGDPFNPAGRIDPLETASLLLTAGQLDERAAIRAITDGARQVMGLPVSRIEEGAAADFVLARATSLIDAIGRSSPERQLWRGGVIVASTRLDAHWNPAGSAHLQPIHHL